MAKAKKLPSGSWRVNQYVGKDNTGKRIYKSFTAGTKKEAEYMAAEYVLSNNKPVVERTIGETIDAYIELKKQVLSPTTIAGYKQIRRNYFDSIMDMTIKYLSDDKLQTAVNEEIMKHSPKSIINAYGLLSSALSHFYPNKNYRITLPRQNKIIKELNPPGDILNIIKGTDIELPCLLALWLSLRMSEILGLKKSDFKNGRMSIQRVKIYADGITSIKKAAKTYDSNRTLSVPDYIQNLVDAVPDEQEYLIMLSGQAIYKRFKRLIQNKGLNDMTFHDLRHMNASVMLQIGIPDKYAMERGGWSSDKILKSVYQHTFDNTRKQVDMQIDNYFYDLIQHEMQHK